MDVVPQRALSVSVCAYTFIFVSVCVEYIIVAWSHFIQSTLSVCAGSAVGQQRKHTRHIFPIKQSSRELVHSHRLNSI